MTVVPFTIAVPDDVLDDLHQRIDRTIWPQEIPGAGFDQGMTADWLRPLVERWRQGYDWRAHEAAMNRWSQVRVATSVGTVHAVHAPGVGPAPLPLVLTHGWPSTFYEMHAVLGPLSDPGAHGGDPADAFHVVTPSLPGYGFSDQPAKRGVDAAAIADAWVELMAALGYDRFGSQGGDWGSAVTTQLGARHPDSLVGIHLNMVAPPIDPAALTPPQRAWWDDLAVYRDQEWGYVHLQRTKPMTPAFGLTDSPVGLAAWILEKWWRWSDVEPAPDELLTTVTIYWVTRTIGSSLRLYQETFGGRTLPVQPPRIEVPAGFALFNEPNRPPRELVEPWYDVRRWTEIDRGGHFPAMENPEALVEEVRAFFRPLR